jgi:cell filamentation protein
MIPGDKACYPGTDVLMNKFDIRNFEQARAAEYKFAFAREVELKVKPIEGKFDFEHLKAIHKHLFQDMYAWAGEIRDIDFAKKSKETGMISRFIPTVVMDLKIEDFNKFMADNNQLKGLTKPEFVKAITEVQAKLNELHPFREGNGRSTRAFLTQLAKVAGYELDLTKIDKTRWNLASAQGMAQFDPKNEANRTIPNKSDIRQIFHESVKPTMAHAFAHEARAEAVKLYPALAQVFDRVDAIQSFANKMPGMEAGKRLVEAERARIAEKLQAGAVPPLNPYLQGRYGPQMARQATMVPVQTLAASAPEKKAARMRM